jgi:hypothetical protein
LFSLAAVRGMFSACGEMCAKYLSENPEGENRLVELEED